MCNGGFTFQTSDHSARDSLSPTTSIRHGIGLDPPCTRGGERAFKNAGLRTGFRTIPLDPPRAAQGWMSEAKATRSQNSPFFPDLAAPCRHPPPGSPTGAAKCWADGSRPRAPAPPTPTGRRLARGEPRTGTYCGCLSAPHTSPCNLFPLRSSASTPGAWPLPLSPGIHGIPLNSIYHHNLLSDHFSQTDRLLASPARTPHERITPNPSVKPSLCAKPPPQQREEGWGESPQSAKGRFRPQTRRGEKQASTHHFGNQRHPASSLCGRQGTCPGS